MAWTEQDDIEVDKIIDEMIENGLWRRWLPDMEKALEDKMKITKGIISQEIGKMEQYFKELEILFENEENIPDCKIITGTIAEFEKIPTKGRETFPNLANESKWKWLDEYGEKTVYMFTVIKFPYDKNKIVEIKERLSNEKKISLFRVNDKSPEWKKVNTENDVCLYVGSSTNIRQRLKEHLFLCNQSANALHLNQWFDKTIPVRILTWDFSKFLENEGDNFDYLQIIEDLLWQHYQPLLGKQGKK